MIPCSRSSSASFLAFSALRTDRDTCRPSPEVDTTPILAQALRDGKRVALPKTYGSEMRFIWVNDLQETQKSALGCPEPIADEPIADDPDALVLLPGLAFDLQGGRMGYGGGFYDKFLEGENHPTVALCYGFQLLPRVPVEAHDLRADCIISTDEWR